MMAKTVRALTAATVLLGGMAAAQNENVPILSDLAGEDITVLGLPTDPNVRKATAVVNGDVITDTDIDHRFNLVLAANSTQIDENEAMRLRMQVVRNLIDEKLQIQESTENEITIEDAEIESAYQRVAQNFGMSAEAFANYLRQRGTSDSSIKQQIHAELAWSRLLRRRVEPFVNVGDDEVQSMIDRMEQAKGTDEYHLAELVLFTTPETAPQVMENANKIVEQLRNGGSFPVYARQFSESSTAAIGGDLGWVRLANLPAELQPVVANLPEGQITNPIQIPGSTVILALVDKRQVLMSNEDDAILSLKQTTVPLGAVGQAAAEDVVRKLQNATVSMGGCGGAEAMAADFGGEVVVNDRVRLGDLPGPLRNIMNQLQIGQSTPPFGSMEEGLKVLTLCGREDPEQAVAPDFDRLYAQLEEERINRAARGYLRDLRRDAIVDYR